MMVLVEAPPAEVTKAFGGRATWPVIGCGAGPACHGQVVVLHDLLGMTDWQPAFAAPACRLGEGLVQAGRAWCSRVSTNELGEHPIVMPPDQLEAFRRALTSRGG